MKQITKRLLPGDDLKVELDKLLHAEDIQAGAIVSLVGGLGKTMLRMPDGKTVRTWDGPFEIVSGTGTVSVHGSHVHLAVSDMQGTVVGGHLKPGCIVRTTVEVVLLKFEDTTYVRKLDPASGYEELFVE